MQETASSAAGEKRLLKSLLNSSFSMGFRSYMRHFLAALSCVSVLHCHGDLRLGVVRF